MKYRINKEKCVGCRVCVRNCPGATELGADGKAEIIDQKKLEECGGEDICPMGAIEKIEHGEGAEAEAGIKPEFTPGRGMGAGRGRGLGLGPRDGRGRGLGGGGRRR